MHADAGADLVDEADRPASSQTHPQLPIGRAGQVAILDESAAGSECVGAHGYGELVGRAVMVVNGVSRRTMQDVLRAESVARGRCRAIVRVPWDDLLSARPGSSSTPPGQTALHPQTRLAYTALAGVLVAGMAADPSSPVPGRNPGEHSD